MLKDFLLIIVNYPKRIASTQIFNVRCIHEKINADT